MAHTSLAGRVERVDEVPPQADVADFDEMGEQEQAALPRLLDGEAVSAVPGASGLAGPDVINYTDYYRVEYGG